MAVSIKESEYFFAWLVYWICGTVGGFIAGAIIGGIVGFILGISGIDPEGNSFKWICAGMGGLAGIIISYVLFRILVAAMIVKKVETRAQIPVQS